MTNCNNVTVCLLTGPASLPPQLPRSSDEDGCLGTRCGTGVPAGGRRLCRACTGTGPGQERNCNGFCGSIRPPAQCVPCLYCTTSALHLAGVLARYYFFDLLAVGAYLAVDCSDVIKVQHMSFSSQKLRLIRIQARKPRWRHMHIFISPRAPVRLCAQAASARVQAWRPAAARAGRWLTRFSHRPAPLCLLTTHASAMLLALRPRPQTSAPHPTPSLDCNALLGTARGKLWDPHHEHLIGRATSKTTIVASCLLRYANSRSQSERASYDTDSVCSSFVTKPQAEYCFCAAYSCCRDIRTFIEQVSFASHLTREPEMFLFCETALQHCLVTISKKLL